MVELLGLMQTTSEKQTHFRIRDEHKSKCWFLVKANGLKKR